MAGRSLDLAQTAVYEEFNAGDVTALVGGEERDRFGDLIRGSRSAQRNGRNTSQEKLGDGVRRITSGYGADIVIDGIGGAVLSEALGALAFEGSLTTLGYSASRQTTIDVTKLIVPQASIRSLNMFTQPKAVVTDDWNVYCLFA
jgi:hypothetical protein